MNEEIELKKAWNLIIDYCGNTDCNNCMFDRIYCMSNEPLCENEKIEVSND